MNKKYDFTDFSLPTEIVRAKVLDIFHELCISKRETQTYFQAQEVLLAVRHVWEGFDCPETAEEIHTYLMDASLSKPTEYKYHKEFGFRYLFGRDH